MTNYSKLFFCFVVPLMVCSFFGCQTAGKEPARHADIKQWMSPNGKMKILATTAMIGDLVEKIGGQHVDTLVLIQGDLDPHSYQLVKGDDEKLSYADYIFYNGLGLEHGPSLQHFLQDNPRALSIGDYIRTMKPEKILYYGKDVDPHIWMDISLWKQAIPHMVHALSEKDPIHAEDYRKQGQILYQTFDEEHKKLQTYLQSVPEEKRYLVTSHDAFNYFTRAYLATEEERDQHLWQKRFQAPEGLSPDSQLSTHEIQALLTHIKTYQIATLFPESNLSPDSIVKLQEASSELANPLHISSSPLYGDAMGPSGSSGDTYLKMLWHNAKTMKEEWSRGAN